MSVLDCHDLWHETSTEGGASAALAGPRHAADRGRPPARPGADRAGQGAAIVSLLDGSRDTAEVARTAAAYGIGQDAVDKVLGLLASAGVLDDFPAGLRATLPGYLLERITPELACAALAYGHGDGGAAVLARRRAAFARVYGAGRVGACIATFLAASGVAWVSCVDSGTGGPGRHHPGRLGRADVGAKRSAGVARAVHRVAREVRTADDAAGCPTWPCSPAGPTRWCWRPDAAARAAPGGARGRGDRGGRAAGAAGPVGLRALPRPEQDGAGSGLAAHPRAGRGRRRPAHRSAGVRHRARGGDRRARHRPGADADRPGGPAGAANGTLELVLPDWQWQRAAGRPIPPAPAARPRSRAGGPPV